MTQANWSKLVELGVSGDHTATCFPASIDCLLDDRDIPASVYRVCDHAYNNQKSDGYNSERSTYIFQLVLRYTLGDTDLEKLKPKIILRHETCIKVIDEARETKKLIILRVSESHDVGLKPITDKTWLMVGNALPTKRILLSDEIFKYLYIPPISNQLETQFNMFIIG